MGDNLGRGGENGFALDLCEMDFFCPSMEQKNLRRRRGDTDFYMDGPESDPNIVFLFSKMLCIKRNYFFQTV